MFKKVSLKFVHLYRCLFFLHIYDWMVEIIKFKFVLLISLLGYRCLWLCH